MKLDHYVHNRHLRALCGVALAVILVPLSPIIAAICIAWERLLRDLYDYICAWVTLTGDICYSIVCRSRWFKAHKEASK